MARSISHTVMYHSPFPPIHLISPCATGCSQMLSHSRMASEVDKEPHALAPGKYGYPLFFRKRAFIPPIHITCRCSPLSNQKTIFVTFDAKVIKASAPADRSLTGLPCATGYAGSDAMARWAACCVAYPPAVVKLTGAAPRLRHTDRPVRRPSHFFAR